MTRASKAGLLAALKEAGITIPSESEQKMDNLRHRLRYWRPGKGFIIRLIRNPIIKQHTPASMLKQGQIYWIPNSRMAHEIIKTQLVFVMGRTPEPPKDAIVMDVPSDYNQRWPLGWNRAGENDGSNDNTDS